MTQPGNRVFGEGVVVLFSSSELEGRFTRPKVVCLGRVTSCGGRRRMRFRQCILWSLARPVGKTKQKSIVQSNVGDAGNTLPQWVMYTTLHYLYYSVCPQGVAGGRVCVCDAWRCLSACACPSASNLYAIPSCTPFAGGWPQPLCTQQFAWRRSFTRTPRGRSTGFLPYRVATTAYKAWPRRVARSVTNTSRV